MITRILLPLVCLLVVYACQSPDSEVIAETSSETIAKESEERRIIEQLIVDAYINGLQNEGDTAAIDTGFHPDFMMTGRDEEGNLWKFPIAEWRSRKIERRSEGNLPLDEAHKVSAEFDWVDVSDDVAMVKLRYFEGEEHTYTDYISLYKIQGEWKIIAKVFTKIESKS